MGREVAVAKHEDMGFIQLLAEVNAVAARSQEERKSFVV
jgi:hypothetical protein